MAKNRMIVAMALAGVLALASGAARAGAGDESGDHHVGYYYPAPATHEVYQARVPTLPDSDRRRRIGFVTVLTGQMLQNPYPPQFAVFAKGTEAQKLIITALTDNGYNTLYRARALFAMLTAMARGTRFFQDLPEADRYTFFDLAKLLGFSQITFTDGNAFAHQIEIK